MRVLTITKENKELYELMTSPNVEPVILTTIGGQQFALISLNNWVGFDVGSSEDFSEEVKQTGQNQELLDFLKARRTGSPKRKSLAKLKADLGI